MDFAIWLLKNLLLLPVGFVVGLFLPHVQKPLAEYRETLTDISKLMLRSVSVMHSDPPSIQSSETEIYAAESRKFYDDVRTLHGRLVSSTDSIPRFARPVLQLLGLLRTRDQIKLGAQMLIGISNQVISADKDKPYLTTLIKRLGAALDITV
jgi:hypothetical protein